MGALSWQIKLTNGRDQMRPSSVKGCRTLPHGSLVEEGGRPTRNIVYCTHFRIVAAYPPVKPLHLYYSLVIRPRAENSGGYQYPSSIALASVICDL